MSEAELFSYRNISGSDQTLMGVGFVKKGGIITHTEPIENPNFAPLSKSEHKKHLDALEKKKAEEAKAKEQSEEKE